MTVFICSSTCKWTAYTLGNYPYTNVTRSIVVSATYIFPIPKLPLRIKRTWRNIISRLENFNFKKNKKNCSIEGKFWREITRRDILWLCTTCRLYSLCSISLLFLVCLRCKIKGEMGHRGHERPLFPVCRALFLENKSVTFLAYQNGTAAAFSPLARGDRFNNNVSKPWSRPSIVSPREKILSSLLSDRTLIWPSRM